MHKERKTQIRVDPVLAKRLKLSAAWMGYAYDYQATEDAIKEWCEKVERRIKAGELPPALK